MAVTIHNFGLNNIDLEGRAQSELNIIAYVPQSVGKRPAIKLPAGEAIEVDWEGEKYYGKLDVTDHGNPPKIFRSVDDGTVRYAIIVDDKYDFDGSLVRDKTPKDVEVLEIKVTEATGGGGAYNTAFGQQVYLSKGLSHSEIVPEEIKVRLIVPDGHTTIMDKLPEGIDYIPLHGLTSNVPLNLNFAPLNDGRKITVRSQAKFLDADDIDLKMSSGDVVALNTVKDIAYLRLLENVLYSNKDVRLFIAATDSMIKALGNDKVLELVRRSDVYVSNNEELGKLIGTPINDAVTLVNAIKYIQSTMSPRDGLPGRVYVTLGSRGSIGIGRDKIIYYQHPSPAIIDPITDLAIINTSGAGDAFYSLVTIEEVLGKLITEIIGNANIAGHICTNNPTASGNWMATEKSIRDFRNKYGTLDFLRYDERRGFVKTRI